MEKLLNKEITCDQNVDSDVKESLACVTAKEEAIRTLSKMRHGKASGQSGGVNEMLKASEDVGEDWLTDVRNSVIRERKITEDWW